MEGLRESVREGERKSYEALWGGGVPDAFSLLANGVKEVGTVGRWKTGSYADTGARGDINGSHGGMVAIRRLKKEFFPGAKIIANSYNAPTPDGRWPEERHAEVAAAEFAAANIPKEDIILQEASFSTLTELLNNIKLTVENGWRLVVIVTNGAQVGRTRAMLEHIDEQQAPYLRKVLDSEEVRGQLDSFLKMRERGEVKIVVISAEDALEKMGRRHEKFVDEVHNTPLYQESKLRQDATIPDLEKGTYGLTPPPATITGEDGKK